MHWSTRLVATYYFSVKAELPSVDFAVDYEEGYFESHCFPFRDLLIRFTSSRRRRGIKADHAFGN